jgi:hypothetical protein
MNVLSTTSLSLAFRARRAARRVRQAEDRVRQGLDVEHLRRGFDRALDRGEVGRVHPREREAELPE